MASAGSAALDDAVDEVAADTGFSGAVRVDRGGDVELARAYGLADRAHGIANTVDTRFGIASGAKSFTALAVVSLVADGVLALGTTARSLLGDDLPLVADDVTVEHLLAHRSGIGDYLDEDDADLLITDYAMPVPVHRLDRPEAYLEVLDGFPTAFPAGERFSYCNGGYVVLAILAERASGTPYAELVADRVCRPAGLVDTSFERSDELPARVAVGYLGDDHGDRTNVLHLPVVGVGDGGITSTLADVAALWTALVAGAIVPRPWVDEVLRPRGDGGYGLGFWLDGPRARPRMEGYDAGISFRSAHDPAKSYTYTVIGNTSDAAWPLIKHIDGLLRAAG